MPAWAERISQRHILILDAKLSLLVNIALFEKKTCTKTPVFMDTDYIILKDSQDTETFYE
jgi:hypothetical protein